MAEAKQKGRRSTYVARP